MDLKPGDKLENRYVIRSQIGDGWKRAVWKGYDEILNRPVTIKFRVNEEGSDDGSQLDSYLTSSEIITNEAQLFAKLEHPQILPVYDLGTHQGEAFLVMRYLENSQSLRMLISRQELSTTQILFIAGQLATLLDYFRERKIVHGDFSPHNFLLDEQFQPYVYNLVVSTAQTALLEINPDGITGSPPYMAPETYLGQEIDTRADLYSFGILLYECLAGEKPFGGQIPLAMSQINHEMGTGKHLIKGSYDMVDDSDYQAQLPSLNKKRASIPFTVDVILNRLTRYNPNERYDSATEAIDELTQAFYSGQSNIEGKVFISYARKDSEYVHNLGSELRGIGLDIWIDQDIEPGSNWDEAIENGLNDCDMMLLITTEASMSSEYVTHEWSYFMGGGKPVYPFIPQTPIPNNIHPRLSRVQHVVGTDDMLNNVARIVDVLAGGTPTKLGGRENQG